MTLDQTMFRYVADTWLSEYCSRYDFRLRSYV